MKPTAEQLAAAQDATIADVIGPDLRVLFCGINPGLWSGATGRHFARPGNRFWPALHRSGFTPRQLRPEEQDELLGLGLGITNVVARTTAKADELTAEEYREGGKALVERVERWRPRVLAVLGIGAYRAAFGRPRATVGPQDLGLGGATGDTLVWLLPNPSGLNAHYTPDGIAAEFRRLRAAVEDEDRAVD
ncbi:G/U mismatch-specific DNA glycosylase [Streptacidiphilus jiangxiensis]|uniref:TDG/mug DNA glycosylase family protein n=1 Tax=Streptacidiphilus jiangxiensis TaxID=235985 RepID=A0A1H7M1U0_STRJI|nr:G/U mismatch-specific DNA glycosylase [Streptacidiphilus jiangxiensis]SEL05062.1 TDG/mug DNA glycosylase family protein [Streptacidiphilus jiangxiensis]